MVARGGSRGSELVRPDIAFVGIWALVLLLYLPFETPLSPPFDPRVLLMVLGNMASAVMIHATLAAIFGRRAKSSSIKHFTLQAADGPAVDKFVASLSTISMALWFAMIAYSGGLPILWIFQEAGAHYYDFGIPTVAGLTFMIRCFVGTLLIFRFSQTGRAVYLFVWALFALLYLTEINRGGLFVFVCHTVAVTCIYFRPSFRLIIFGVLGIALLLASYIWLGSVRGIAVEAGDFGDETEAIFGGMGVGAFWLWTYIVTPIANVNFAAQFPNTHNYIGYFTFMPVIPTVLREFVYGAGLTPDNRYAVQLIVDAYNATSMYGPIVTDFGYFFAFMFVLIFQALTSYIYLLGKHGDDFCRLLYPPLFTSIILSPFYIYFASLVVLSYPFLCLWLRNYVARGYWPRLPRQSSFREYVP